MDAVNGRDWLWLGLNVVVGTPLALAVLIFAREGARAVVALVFGFRVFEFRWGTGPRLFGGPLGPIDIAFGPIPLAGRTITGSGIPRRHRLARMATALAPALLQLCWFLYRSINGSDLLGSLSRGPSIPGTLDAANGLLLGLHLLLPIQLSPGFRTDIRLFFDHLLDQPGSNRAARASYYARLACHRLECADTAGTRQSLELGLVQLGPEPMLIACQRSLREFDLSSVIDQGDCAGGLKTVIEGMESERDLDPAIWSFSERARRVTIMAAPLIVFSISLADSHAESIANHIESAWRHESIEIAASGDRRHCDALLERGGRWAHRVDRFFFPDSSKRSDRHFTFARLERCRGDLAAAAQHRGEALLAANAARTELAPVMFSEPHRWFENELRLTHLFRDAAAVETERQEFRQALTALTNAEKRLEGMHQKIELWPEAEARGQAEETLASERAELLSIRDRVMANLPAH
ncbi:MAG: hypothetical protein GY910_07020 [bacterium]|nr:hypothetical protein [bacterium]